MKKILSWFMSIIIMLSFTSFANNKIFANVFRDFLIKLDPTYADFDLNPSVSEEAKVESGPYTIHSMNDDKNSDFSFDVTKYAADKDSFIKNYQNLEIYSASHGKVAASVYWTTNKWLDEDGKIPLLVIKISDINDIKQKQHEILNWSDGHSEASVLIYVEVSWDSNILKFHFHLNAWACSLQDTEMTLNVSSTLSCNKIRFTSQYNWDNVNTNLKTQLSQKQSFISDYSTSLDDQRNIIDPTGKNHDLVNLINLIIKNALGADYDAWKPYLTFEFDDAEKAAFTTFDYTNPNNQKKYRGYYITPVNIILSSEYWNKNMKQRLTFQPGSIVNPKDSTKPMIIDVPDQIKPPVGADDGGTWRYHTGLNLTFNGRFDESERLEINGVKIPVLNDEFKAELRDNRIDDRNSDNSKNNFQIILYHDGGTIQAQYKITVIIDNLVPNLNLKWYAWDPENQPEQKKLITPIKPDGKPNPKYDKEINPKTGTKTEILWIKHKSTVPTPLDPIDNRSTKINPEVNPEKFDLGFIAEGAVSGMGVNQNFDTSAVKNVVREGNSKSLIPLDNPTDKEKAKVIISDKDYQYWSNEGLWHYTENLNDNMTAQKYIIIGQKYDKKYSKFLDVINNPSIVVDFWTTIHGQHLMKYLVKYKSLDSKQVGALTYEKVASYWKEYVSDIVSNRVPPDPNPDEHIDITGNFGTNKMNVTTLDQARDNIVSWVTNEVRKLAPNAQIEYDFIININGKDIIVDDSVLAPLLDNKTESKYATATISSVLTSTLIVGTATAEIKNSTKYNPDTVIDLSKIKMEDFTYDFSKFDYKTMVTWIIKHADDYLNTDKIKLKYNVDYSISPTVIPLPGKDHHNYTLKFDEKLIKDFLNNHDKNKYLNLIVYADNASDTAVNSTTFQFVNDRIAPPAPPVPPMPPIPTPNSTNNLSTNTTWVISLLSVAIVAISAICYINHHRKKNIFGGIKRRKNCKKLIEKKSISQQRKSV